MDRPSGTSTRSGSRTAVTPSGPSKGTPDDDDYDLRGGFTRFGTATSDTAVPPSDTPPPLTPARSLRWRWAALIGAVLVIAIGVIAVLSFRLGSSSSAGPAPTTTTPATTTATTLPVTDIYRRVAPSVVVIETSKGSLGSGVIVTDTGTILTANHVISDGGSVIVLFSDGTKSSATVSSTNPASDSATLTPSTLPEVVVPAVLGGGLAVGATVVAIGNPLGFTDSTTSGIVSGLDRTAKTDVGRFSGLIQFDAAVNPGSSGGPLLDSKGLVVGIVVSIADPGDDDSFAGIGFAVPIAGALGGGAGKGPGDGPQV
jgi:putative serine protease PepD